MSEVGNRCGVRSNFQSRPNGSKYACDSFFSPGEDHTGGTQKRESDDSDNAETGSRTVPRIIARDATFVLDEDFQRRYVQLPLVRRFLAEFQRQTGLGAKLVAAKIPIRTIKPGGKEHDFCRAVCNRNACQNCYKIQLALFRRLERKMKPQQACCIWGMIQLVIPVVVAGRHIATIVGGKVRIGSGGKTDFEILVPRLQERGFSGRLRQLRAAYHRVPVFTPQQLRSTKMLLDSFAQLIAHCPPPRPSSDPPYMVEVKQFVRLHLGEPLTTREAAKALHLSESYFCRLFRRLTGMTFHKYVAQMRVETSRRLLLSNQQRVGEVGLSAGFQSISDFNRVFKASVGLTPSMFRQKHGTATVRI